MAFDQERFEQARQAALMQVARAHMIPSSLVDGVPRFESLMRDEFPPDQVRKIEGAKITTINVAPIPAEAMGYCSACGGEHGEHRRGCPVKGN